MNTSSFAKVGFVLSVAFLSLVYGYAARWHGWFPDALFEQAQREANAYLNPSFLSDQTYDRSGTRTTSLKRMQPGLTLITSLWKSADGWYPGLKLIDASGQPVHHWRIDRSALFPDSLNRRGAPSQKILHGSYLFPNGDLLVNVDYVGTVRLDACGEVQWRLSAGTHHSIARAHDGTFWIPGTSRTPRSKSDRHPQGFPGLQEPVWQDLILHVSGDGSVIETIHVLDLLYKNNLQRYVSKAYISAALERPEVEDLTHLNDVEPLAPSMAAQYPLFETGDLLISLRNLHLVLVFDPDSEEVKWHASDPFIMQHDPDFIGNGWIGVFDNNTDFTSRGTMLGGSRIVALQPHTDSTVVRFPTAASDPLYTSKMGKWQQLENGNMLLTETRAGRVVEVTPNGRTVWELVRRPYNNSKVPMVPKAIRHDLSETDVASWTCSSNESFHPPR